MISYKILDNIQKYIALNDAEKDYLDTSLTVNSFPKKSFLLNQGQLCKKIYFVVSGSLRAFNTNKDGKESTIMFAIQDWWITDMGSFTQQKPANISVVALEDSEVVPMDFHFLEGLYQDFPKFERFFRMLFQNAYIREQQRALHNLSFNTEERYWQFVKDYPSITKKVTQKQLASYLGVTPEFLSKVKGKS